MLGILFALPDPLYSFLFYCVLWEPGPWESGSLVPPGFWPDATIGAQTGGGGGSGVQLGYLFLQLPHQQVTVGWPGRSQLLSPSPLFMVTSPDSSKMSPPLILSGLGVVTALAVSLTWGYCTVPC